MRKCYNEKYPAKNENQLDFRGALIRLLNCRKYAASEGFQDINVGLGNDSINILFSDGTRLSHGNFKTSKNRDLIIEKMIIRQASIDIRNPEKYYTEGGRFNAVTSSFEQEGYELIFRIQDTTERNFNFFRYTPSYGKMFALDCGISLDQDLISDRDIQEFDRYQKGLAEVIRQTGLISVTNLPEKKQVILPISEVKPEIDDPWRYDIPKLEQIAMGR